MEKQLSIVCIGGGTGLHTELSGLKDEFPDAKLAAVVTMMDSGSNSGQLRDEFGYLPPGDVRQCLVALSDAPDELRQLMQHRFNADKSGLHGHVIGNILLTALKELNGGDEYAAIESMEHILNLRGRVYPVTVTNAQLVAKLEDGTTINGEGNLYSRDNDVRIKSVTLSPNAKIFPQTRDVLVNADYIIIGPGGLHHSILPNLMVEGMAEALKDAKRNGARVILVTNTMTKHGDTNGFAASDFLSRIQSELDDTTIDAVIVNNGPFPEERLRAYALEKAEPVKPDIEDGKTIVVKEDLVTKSPFLKHGKESFARHDSVKLAKAIRKTIMKLGCCA